LKIRFKEETVIFVSVVKWIILATIVGIVTGISTTLYIKGLYWAITTTARFRYYYLLIPLGLLASATIVKRVSPNGKIPGANLAIEAVNRFSGHIPFRVVIAEFFATIVTIATGGSAGKEGPSVQIGGGVISALSGLLRFDNADRRKLVVCGICGAFASVFGAPLTGAMYGLEVMVIGNILYDVLLPAFVAGIISYHVSSALGIMYFYHPINIVPVFSDLFFIKVVIAGIFFGLCSFALVEALAYGKKLSYKSGLPIEIKSIIAGVILIILAFLISTHPLGLGLNVMESAINGAPVPWYDFLFKILFTAITLSFGGTGGKVTPMVFIGATAGSALGRVLGVDTSVLSAIGFVSLLAGASNTPIAASIMAVELFGTAIAPYAAIASIISFAITGHRSVYPSQQLAVKKSASIDIELGKELETVSPKFAPREKSLLGTITTLWEIVWKKKKKPE
jgi:chloride channel protein, CIC family